MNNHRSSAQKAQPPLIIAIGISLVFGSFFLQIPSVQADEIAQPAIQEPAASQPNIEPSNYCVSCHSSEDPRLATASLWRGGIERETINPCPAATRIHEEIYYTERLLLAIDRGMEAIGPEADNPALQSRYLSNVEGYARILDSPVTSLDAFESEAQSLRYQMGKLYAQINNIADLQKRRNAFLVGALVTFFILVALGWGYYNTRQFSSKPAKRAGTASYILVGLFLLLVFGLFALPLFRPVTAEVESASEEEQAITTAHDTAKRFAGAVDRADSRAWMFSQIGAAAWSADTEKAELSLQTALDAAAESRKNDYALWGEAANVREISVSNKALLETAGLIANQLNATRSRAWALALIGSEWKAVDPARAEEIFTEALSVSRGAPVGVYRDLDLRRIAVEWAGLNSARGIETAQQISDPAIRAWALREIASETGESQLYAQAIEAARLIENPFQRARALKEIAGLNGDQALFGEAKNALSEQQGAELAYALSDLATASGDKTLLDLIDPAYPAAQTWAYLGLGQFPQAWETALKIPDPYEKGRAQAAIVAGWANVDAALASQKVQEIEVSHLRERAMRDVIQITGNASLVQMMSIAYYRIQALTGLGQYQAAWEQAAELKEPYPLVALGTGWAKSDPTSAEQVLELLKREADKAQVLKALAEVTGDPEIFERALGMAQAARVRNDALAPVKATLDLFQIAPTPALAQSALERAFEITQRISIK